MNAAKLILLAVVFALLGAIAGGCSRQVGQTRLSWRMANRLPGYTFETADGVIHHADSETPDGDALFFFLRVRY